MQSSDVFKSLLQKVCIITFVIVMLITLYYAVNRGPVGYNCFSIVKLSKRLAWGGKPL